MLIIGIIVDPVHGAALRLLEDIVRLEQLDPALGPLHVVLLENPSEPLSEAKPDERRLHLCGVPDALINGPAAEAWERWRHNLGQVRAHGLRVECISRATQQADASAGFFGRMSLEAGRQPIAIARTMLQRYVAMRCLEVSGAVAWILDEDLRLTPLLTRNEQGKLSGLIHELRGHNVDVAISPILGAPPLPARSSIRVNLTDVLRHLERMAELSPSDRWPDHRNDNARVRAQFPDYYYDFTHAHEDAANAPIWLEPLHADERVSEAFQRLCLGVEGLRFGQPITRGIHDDEGEHPLEPTLARGGNTLVLTPRVLNEIPNLAPRIAGRITRRSDMVWARLAALVGNVRIVRVSIPVVQDRSGPGISGFETAKLLDDLRGSALIAAMDKAFELRAWHKERILVTRPSPAAVQAALDAYEAHRTRRLHAIRESEIKVLALVSRLHDRLKLWTQEHHWFVESGNARLAAGALQRALQTLEAEYEVAGTLRGEHAFACCPEDEREAIWMFLECLLTELVAFRSAGQPWTGARGGGANSLQTVAISR